MRMKIKIIDCDKDRTAELELTQSQWRELQAFLRELRNPPAQDYKSVLDCFNEICTGLPPVSRLTDKRRRAIAKAQKDGYDLEQVFRTAAQSSFLRGRNDRRWRASFDWIMQPGNLIKVAEGQYSDSVPAPVPEAPMSGNPFDEYG